jgi:predicted RNase H-like HicB family nuclease
MSASSVLSNAISPSTQQRMKKTLVVIVNRCVSTGLLVGYIPGLAGAHSQASTVEELRANLAEVLELLGESATIDLHFKHVADLERRA